jgi:transcriptional regulator with XRE-family HTH domain
MNLLDRLGWNVRILRQAAGLSQEALADLCNSGRTYIGGIERGVENPTLTKLDDIAVALGVTITDLLAEDIQPVAERVRTERLEVVRSRRNR